MMDEPAGQIAQGNNIAQALGQQAIAAVIQQATIQQATLPEGFLSLLSEVLTRPVLQPQFNDLFEIVRNPAEVPAAIFRIDPGRGLAPYDVPYVKDREGLADTQSVLYEALLDSGGTLLVQSRAGLGKTREVAELAGRLCDEGWTICVAKGAGDTHINTLDAFPDDLRGNRLLFVLDDLHRRVDVAATVQKPYSERLNAFLAFFDSKMAPGEMYVIATTRTEPHHQKQLGFDTSQPLWSRFKIYELPEFTLDGLQIMLVTLAGRIGIQLDETQAAQMVSNSDRTLRTLVENVERSRWHGQRLTLDLWLPSQGRTWEARFREARGRHPKIEEIYQALHLIREIGVQTRVAYVINLAAKLADFDATSSVDDLVDRGLLGLRSGLLDVFGDEQLADSLQATGKTLPQLEMQYEAVIESIVDGVEAEREWLDDLATLVDGLSKRGRIREVDATAATVISRGLDNAPFYFALAVAKFDQGNYSRAEEDFTTAIAREQDDAMVYYHLRGVARYLQGNYSGAEEDFTTAIAQEQDNNAMLYYLRGMARYLQDNHAGAEEDFTAAEEDFTTAIAREQDGAMLYHLRGMARYLQDNHAGAEEDFTTAIALRWDNPVVYYLRGLVRAKQGNHAGAEGDFTTAITRNWDATAVYHSRAMARYLQGNHAGAEEDFTTVNARGQKDLRDILLKILEVIDYDDNREEYADEFLKLIPALALTNLVQSLTTEKQAEIKQQLSENADDLEKISSIFRTYFSQQEFREASEAVTKDLITDFIQTINPTLSAYQRENLFHVIEEFRQAHYLLRVIETEQLFEGTLAIRQRVLGPEHPDTLSSRHNLAITYSDLGRHQEAVQLLEETLRIRERVLGPEHPDSLSSRHNLASGYRAVGRDKEADDLESKGE